MATRLGYGSRRVELRLGEEARAPAEHCPLRFEDQESAGRFLRTLAADERNRVLLSRALGRVARGAVPFAAARPLDRLARLLQTGRAVLVDVEWSRTRRGHRRRIGKAPGGRGGTRRSTDDIEWGESTSRTITEKGCDAARAFHMQRTLTSRVGHVVALKIGTATLTPDLVLEVPGSWKAATVVGAIEQVTWTEEQAREASDEVDPDEAEEAFLEALGELGDAVADRLAERLHTERRARARERRAPSWLSPAMREALTAIEAAYGALLAWALGALERAGAPPAEGEEDQRLPTDLERDAAWDAAVAAAAPGAADVRATLFALADVEDPAALEDENEDEDAPPPEDDEDEDDEDEPTPAETLHRARLWASLSDAHRRVFPPPDAEQRAAREIRKRRRLGLLSQRLASRRRSALSLGLRVSARNKQALRMLLQTEDFDDVEVKVELRVYEYDPVGKAYHTALATTSGGLTARAPCAFEIDDDPQDDPVRPVTYSMSIELATTDDPQELHLAYGKRKVHVMAWGEFIG